MPHKFPWSFNQLGFHKVQALQPIRQQLHDQVQYDCIGVVQGAEQSPHCKQFQHVEAQLEIKGSPSTQAPDLAAWTPRELRHRESRGLCSWSCLIQVTPRSDSARSRAQLGSLRSLTRSTARPHRQASLEWPGIRGNWHKGSLRVQVPFLAEQMMVLAINQPSEK